MSGTSADLTSSANAWLVTSQVSGSIAREAALDRRLDVLRNKLATLLSAASALGVDLVASDVPLRPTATQVQLQLRYGLTEREMQVLRRMSLGQSNGDIARELFISVDTVKTHASRMFRKIRARDRAHAAAIAIRLGLIP